MPRHWRLNKQRYNLEGSVCNNCDTKSFPPRPICPGCGEGDKKPFKFSGKGSVYSYATVHDAPAGFEKYEPFEVALIQLDEGAMVLAQLTELDDKPAEIGMSVEMVTRELRQNGDSGMLIYGYKFRPSLSGDNQAELRKDNS